MGIVKFTDRFVKLPIKVYNTKEAELTGNAEYFDDYAKLLPFEISNYRSQVDEANNNSQCVSVTLKNGDSFYIYLSMSEFEKAINDHQSSI